MNHSSDRASLMDSLSVSPSQLLARLQALRSLQDAARDKLEQQRLKFGGREISLPIMVQDLLSQKSMDSSSYQAFIQLLDSSRDCSPCSISCPSVHKIHPSEQMEGVSQLDLSQKTECSRSLAHSPTKSSVITEHRDQVGDMANISKYQSGNSVQKCIDLDNMPVLSPRQNFEQLILEKIQCEEPHSINKNFQKGKQSKPFLRRGQGLTRFGLKNDDLVIQYTNLLPWRRKSRTTIQNATGRPDLQIQSAPALSKQFQGKIDDKKINRLSKPKGTVFLTSQKKHDFEINVVQSKQSQQEMKDCMSQNTITPPRNTKLTNNQDNILKQMKQSSFYKHYESPLADAADEICCDESLQKARQQREKAEQNLFEFLEKRVTNASFSSESSFLQKFLNGKPDCSGDNTPMMLKKCLTKNPQLLQLFPPPKCSEGNFEQTAENCECTECDDTCSNSSSCSMCTRVEGTAQSLHTSTPQLKESTQESITVIPKNEIKAEIADMNARIVATNELLKERLKELDSEIETFRQENANLTRLRQELNDEKKRFYDEKSAFDQKTSEDRILSEYYLAEEKEKIFKQKQVYERYIREAKGRINKKENDEIVRLKKENEEIKGEFRSKEARSAAYISRLRTQIKAIEKEKNDLIDECEKLKRENRRIQQVNVTTKRLSNLKYLSEINKKLAQIDSKQKFTNVDDSDAHYKCVENGSYGRARKLLPTFNNQLKVRAKSVPDLSQVTSHYAKYFSQRDAMTHRDCTQRSSENSDNLSLQSDKSSNIYYDDLGEYEKSTSCSHNASKVFDRIVEASSTKAPHVQSGNSSKSLQKSESLVPPLNLSQVNYAKSPVSIMNNHLYVGSQKSIQSGQCIDDCHNEEKVNENSRNSITCTNINPTEIKRPDGTRELRFPNGNLKILSADGKTSKFMYYNGDVKETFFDEGKVKYFYADLKTYHTTHVDGLEVLEFPDGQVEKRYPDGSDEIRLPNGSVRYTDPRNRHVSEEWRFPDGAVLTVARDGEQRVRLPNGQIEVHANDHKRREYPDGTVKVVYADGASETRYASGRVRIRDKHGALVCDSATSDK